MPIDGTWGHCGTLGCDPPVDRVNFHRSPSIRVLYHWAPEARQPVTNIDSAGCDEILAKEPRFTRTLCEKLGPIS
ncbi:hypothetical protein SD37_34015 [Amycolatopsis orientalis]|uniref:Uncharacterized protein n=1 Tax=Amycolatopsis orientalis TaxID=31958 RepID=A0A193C6M0_AMYOR|nr:hypothetical protein [Amycolatopsis orientalis]ANN20127.1 hypothetical protein SD37_34015 [Amycolatopsis orientalis]